MNRPQIFLLGVMVGSIGVGVAVARINQFRPDVADSLAACPPIPAATVCPAAETSSTIEPVAAPPTVATTSAAQVVLENLPIPPQATIPASDAAVPPPATAREPLLIPVAGITGSQLHDTFNDARGSHRVHDAIDIMAARGTPVLAVADGKVVKLFTSIPGGLTVYHFDVTDRYAYYYAHLDGYAPGISEGRFLKRGEVLGFVGYSGNASPNAPHLHFAIFELGPEKRWWQGTAINPYPLLLSGRSPP